MSWHEIRPKEMHDRLFSPFMGLTKEAWVNAELADIKRELIYITPSGPKKVKRILFELDEESDDQDQPQRTRS